MKHIAVMRKWCKKIGIGNFRQVTHFPWSYHIWVFVRVLFIFVWQDSLNAVRIVCCVFVIYYDSWEAESLLLQLLLQIFQAYTNKLTLHHRRFLKVYYVAKNRDPDRQGPPPDADGTFHLEELFLDNLPISRYDMMDGDEIHIDVQKEMQGRCRMGRSNNTTIRTGQQYGIKK